MALKYTLEAMAWLPDVLGPARENHIMRTSNVVTNVESTNLWLGYETIKAPGPAIDVLRLSSHPRVIKADSSQLEPGEIADGNGYEVRDLACGDCIVTIRHDGAKRVDVKLVRAKETCRAAVVNDDFAFEGNRIRVTGIVGPEGGLADVLIDGVKQRAGIDCWNPTSRSPQNLFERNGLTHGKHTLRIVPTNTKNPLSKGTEVLLGTFHSSAATGNNGFGEGGGPTDAQRMIFGYAGRADVIDSQGRAWRPGTEFVVRAGHLVDSVTSSWWTQRRQYDIAGTDDDELYRYGVHAPEFWTNLTVGPGAYHVRLKFAETRRIKPEPRAFSIWINGQQVVADMDIAATAEADGKANPQSEDQHPYATVSGFGRAVDLVFNDVKPQHGIIRIRFKGHDNHEAIVQAIEVSPGPGGEGATPVTLPGSTQPAKK
jgi:hypothetical protein